MKNKMLGKPSMKTGENCDDGAAQKAELRVSHCKTQRRRASEPMSWWKGRIAFWTHETENTVDDRVKMKTWPNIKE
jgi:hypothetical protein